MVSCQCFEQQQRPVVDLVFVVTGGGVVVSVGVGVGVVVGFDLGCIVSVVAVFGCFVGG